MVDVISNRKEILRLTRELRELRELVLKLQQKLEEKEQDT